MNVNLIGNTQSCFIDIEYILWTLT